LVECDTAPCQAIVADWYAQKPRLLQQIGGYILFSPDNRFQKVFLIHGPSANGKGTFLRVLTTILEQKVEGERLAFAVNFDEFAPSERVNLLGKQLIYDAELSGSPKSARWVKLISGGDKLTARALYKSQVTFLPTCKIVLLSNPIPDWGNHPPLVRRLVLMNFKKTFKIDPVKELSYMTDDMLKRWVWFFKQGYDELCKHGFDLIQENVADEFLSQADNLSLFLQERCHFQAEQWIPAATLYQQFKEFWNELEDRRPMPNMREVGKRLREYGIEKHRNVTLKDDELKRFGLLKVAPEMVEADGKTVTKPKDRWDMYKGVGLKEMNT
jgi:putative DNA primase/helicase